MRAFSSPALVAADHVAVIVCEAADAARDVGSVAAVLRRAQRGAPGRLVLPKHALARTHQHRRWGGRGGRRGRPSPIVMILTETHGKAESDTSLRSVRSDTQCCVKCVCGGLWVKGL